MSLRGTEIKRLWGWFQHALNAEPKSFATEEVEERVAALKEPRFGRLLGIEPRWRSGNVAFYAPEDMIAAGFTESMAYYHTTDLGVNYTTGLYIAELSCLVKDVRKLRSKEFALLKQYGVEETFEEVQEAFDEIISDSTKSWKAFGIRNDGLKHKSPTVFVLFKLNSVDSISDFTSGYGAIHSYKTNWDPEYATFSLEDLYPLFERFSVITDSIRNMERNRTTWEGGRLGLFQVLISDWMNQRCSEINSKTLDMNLSRRIVQLEQIFIALQHDIVQPCADHDIEVPSLADILEYIEPALPSEVLTAASRVELSWLRGLISGTVDSEGILGDMARIRQRLRDVLGQEGTSNEHTHVSYQVFVEWIVENKANIQTLLDTEPPVIEKPEFDGPILLTWNPNKWNGWDYPSFVQRTLNGEQVSDQWTVGKRNIAIDTPVMLVIQNSSNGVGGVLGLGITTGDVFDDEHGRLSVPLLWSHLLPIENHIPYAELKVLAPDTYFMTQRSGYVSIKSEQEHIAVVEEFMARFEEQRSMLNEGPIELWPVSMQRKTVMYPSGNNGIHFLQNIADLWEDGTTFDQLLDDLVEHENMSASKKTLGNSVKHVIDGFDFLKRDGDALSSTPEFIAFKSSQNVDGLTKNFLVRAYLVAELLQWISEEPRTKEDIQVVLRQKYPSWTSNVQMDARILWMRIFGMISPAIGESTRNRKYKITEYGQSWLDRINFEGRLMLDDVELVAEEDIKEFTESNFQDILNKIRENTKDQKIVVDEDEIKDIHNGFHANSEKRFIILSGLSGTGKTKMLQEYARAYCELQDLEYDAHVFPVAVTPAFRDHTLLLGYLNPLTEPPRYIEGEITALLREAAETPHLPYFLILDEMNLARVEFYLAPILSAMESDEGVVFHNSDAVDFPQRIKQWPSNIFMAGTVNMDETTHAFSDKVLDRAFTMEFWDIDLATYFEQSPTDAFVQDTITNVYNALKPAHLHFGYRTVKAIVDYVDRAVETDANDQKRALDQAIFSKVLPKLKGQKTTLLTKTLDEMLKVCAVLSRKSGETEKSKTLNKLTQMQARLKETGLTRFWR